MVFGHEAQKKEQIPSVKKLLSQFTKMKEQTMALTKYIQKNKELHRERISVIHHDLHHLLEKEEERRLSVCKEREELVQEDLERRIMNLLDLSSSIAGLHKELKESQLTLETKKQLEHFSMQVKAGEGFKPVLDTSFSPLVLREWNGMRHLVKPVPESLTFDPKSAHPNLILSPDLKQVSFEPLEMQKRSKDCFQPVLYILGSRGFQSGRHYWEVDVGQKTNWIVGITKESMEHKEEQLLTATNGYWVLRKQEDGVYFGLGHSPIILQSKFPPTRIGVCLDFLTGRVTFYDADTATLLCEFSDCSTGEKMFPFFCPGIPFKEEDWCPMILIP